MWKNNQYKIKKKETKSTKSSSKKKNKNEETKIQKMARGGTARAKNYTFSKFRLFKLFLDPFLWPN